MFRPTLSRGGLEIKHLGFQCCQEARRSGRANTGSPVLVRESGALGYKRQRIVLAVIVLKLVALETAGNRLIQQCHQRRRNWPFRVGVPAGRGLTVG